ncbi:MAG: LLM class flavin-dependent oxidoreductase [Chloroflexota bacterium]|nr:LLM class flavin-dependent oxidoreductase [Chloroflexota bacterium]
MRLAVTLMPTGDWAAILSAARIADVGGLDAVGLWDHFHSQQPEEQLVGGWSAYGALAAATERIRLTPLVLDRLNHTLQGLAKESASLSIISGGRLELGIGAGGWRGEHEAWGQPFPGAGERVKALEETVLALRELWSGEPVSFEGEYIRLHRAACRPAPPHPPWVVVGASASRRLIRSAVTYADELNVDSDPSVLSFASQEIQASGRKVALSVIAYWMEWPRDAAGELRQLEEQGVERVFVNLAHPFDLLPRLVDLSAVL